MAGCLASWEGVKSLRAPATAAACGDDAGPCEVPADACETASAGRFSAAISHCQSQSSCEVDASAEASYACYESGWCSEPVCCGQDCGDFGACTGGVWPEKTHIAQGMDQGCAAQSSRRAGGVLCCRPSP